MFCYWIQMFNRTRQVFQMIRNDVQVVNGMWQCAMSRGYDGATSVTCLGAHVSVHSPPYPCIPSPSPIAISQQPGLSMGDHVAQTFTIQI